MVGKWVVEVAKGMVVDVVVKVVEDKNLNWWRLDMLRMGGKLRVG